jgi:hypothetical protein
MKFRKSVIAAAAIVGLCSSAAHAGWDAWGRPTPTDSELCEQAQRIPGSIVSSRCAFLMWTGASGGGYLAPAEHSVQFDFRSWGYYAVVDGISEDTAKKLNNDDAFREQFIKQHKIDRYTFDRLSAKDKEKIRAGLAKKAIAHGYKPDDVVFYHFDRYGYDHIEGPMSLNEAMLLDSDAVLRNAYIKSNGAKWAKAEPLPEDAAHGRIEFWELW